MVNHFIKSRFTNVLGRNSNSGLDPFLSYDMHGNAGEWIANWYAGKSIAQHYAMGDLTGPAKGSKRVVRGGSWDESRNNLRSSYRNLKSPVSGRSIYGSIGFRCVVGG